MQGTSKLHGELQEPTGTLRWPITNFAIVHFVALPQVIYH